MRHIFGTVFSSSLVTQGRLDKPPGCERGIGNTSRRFTLSLFTFRLFSFFIPFSSSEPELTPIQQLFCALRKLVLIVFLLINTDIYFFGQFFGQVGKKFLQIHISWLKMTHMWIHKGFTCVIMKIQFQIKYTHG